MQRVFAIPAEEHVVKLRFNFAVAHAAVPDILLHAGVAGGVQRKMAEEAQRVGQRGVSIFRFVHHAPGPLEENRPRLLVHGVAQRAHRGRFCRVVVEQQVRPVQADVIQLPVRSNFFLQFRGQAFQNIRAKASVCIGGWHNKGLLYFTAYSCGSSFFRPRSIRARTASAALMPWLTMASTVCTMGIST